jgi:hypothetical protein
MPIKPDQINPGVPEIFFIYRTGDYHTEFIEKIVELIPVTLMTNGSIEEMRIMYEGTRQMTGEMSAQEEELRQNPEEMSITREEMSRQ